MYDKNKINPLTLELMENYLTEKKLEHKSNITIKEYRGLLYRFFSECNQELAFISSNNILNWIEVFKIGKSPSTLNSYLSALYCFFNYCLSENILDKNPVKNRWRSKKPESLPKFLSNQDHIKVKINSEKLSLRDRTIIEFLDSSGVRVSEARALNISDINILDSSARILGKGNKERYVYFSKECGYLLKTLIDDRSGESPLFLNRKNERLSVKYIQKITYKLGKKSG